MDSFEELKDVVRKLRAPDGCPWDKEQTHDSLKPGIIEEANLYLPEAFDEACELIDKARKRKGFA